MKPSAINKEQAIKIVKAAGYVGVSAALDFLISSTAGTEFGVLTPLINVALVAAKQWFTTAK